MKKISYRKEKITKSIGWIVALSVIAITTMLVVLPLVIQAKTLNTNITISDVMNIYGVNDAMWNTIEFTVTIPLLTLLIATLLSILISWYLPTKFLRESVIGFLRLEHFIFTSILSTLLSLFINNGDFAINNSKWIVISVFVFMGIPSSMILILPVISKNIIIHRMRKADIERDSFFLITKNVFFRSSRSLSLSLLMSMLTTLFINPIFIYGSNNNILLSHNQTLMSILMQYASSGNYTVSIWLSIILLIPGVTLGIFISILILKVNKERKGNTPRKEMGNKWATKLFVLIMGSPYIIIFIIAIFFSTKESNTPLPNSIPKNNYSDISSDEWGGIWNSVYVSAISSLILTSLYIGNAFYAVYMKNKINELTFYFMLLCSVVNKNIFLIGTFIMFSDYTQIDNGALIIILASLSSPMTYVWIHIATVTAHERKRHIFKGNNYSNMLIFKWYIKDSKLLLKYIYMFIVEFNAYYFNHLISISFDFNTFTTEVLRIKDENNLIDINKRLAYTIVANTIIIIPALMSWMISKGIKWKLKKHL